jgi:flagellar motor switch protein FliM
LAARSKKVPLIATARLTTFKLAARDFQRLALGDLLVTDASPQQDVSLQIDGNEIFRGAPGQSRDRRVIRLTIPVRPAPNLGGSKASG